jgi:TPR repeat protein
MGTSAKTFPLLAALLAVSRAGAAESWTEAKTPHFTVIADGGEDAARRAGRRLEQVRAAFRLFLPMARAGSPRPIVAFAVKDEGSARRLFEGVDFGRGTPAGLFVPGSERHLIVVRADAPGDVADRVVNHEYVHALLRQNDHRVPLWLEEGLAEFYGATVVGDQRITIGMVAPEHLHALKELRLMPLHELFAAQRATSKRHGDAGTTVFYAQSWALVHFLSLADDRKHAARLSQLSKLLADEVPVAEAAAQALGDLDALEKQLASYVRGLRFAVAYLPAAVDVPDPRTFAVRRLPEAEALAAKAELSASLRALPVARARAEAAAMLAPDDPRVAEVMARVAVLEDKHEEALGWAKRAVAAGTPSLLAHWVHAEALLAKGDDASKREAEASLLRVTVNHPWFGPAAERLADLYVRRRGDLEEAARLARQAVGSDPGVTSHHLVLAHVLQVQGRKEEAARELAIASSLAGDDERERVASYRKWMEESEARAPAARSVERMADACQRGDLEACADLGLRYEKGHGVARDASRARELYRKACDGGWGNGCMVFGVARFQGSLDETPDPTAGIALLEKGCTLGEAQACVIAGELLFRGVSGRADVPKAGEFYASACRAGNIDGCVGEAMVLVNRGLHGKAVGMLRKACDEGHARGCSNLGILYEMGMGVPRELATAQELWRKACSLGSDDACSRVSRAK